MITHAQLEDLGYSPEAIRHRVSTGRLHRMRRGVYAVGRPAVNRHGRWMAATLACGPDAMLSHSSAAALWEIGVEREVEVSVPYRVVRRPIGIVIHRRKELEGTRHHGIPVTTVASTLVDLADRLGRVRLERAINEADQLGLISPPALRAAVDRVAGRPGVPALRRVLDRRTFRLTRSELERLFRPVARRAGLTQPQTQRRLNGFVVDFYWPELGLVVETDGLRYHRTPAQQARDRLRDQAHTAAGLTPLRFTHEQVRYERDYVEETLRRVARRLRG